MDIAIVGAGTLIPEQMTIEALEILRECKIVYTILPPDDEAWLGAFLDTRVESLYGKYVHSRPRDENYRQAVATVIDSARSTRPVAFLTRGSPMVFDSVAAGIIRQAGGLEVKVVPGISSVEVIMTLLGEDYAYGVHIADATSVVAKDVILSPQVTHLLLQPGVFGSSYSSVGRRPESGVLMPLKHHLQRFYSDRHEVLLVRVAQRAREEAKVYHSEIGSLGKLGTPELWGTTLVLPRKM